MNISKTRFQAYFSYLLAKSGGDNMNQAVKDTFRVAAIFSIPPSELDVTFDLPTGTVAGMGYDPRYDNGSENYTESLKKTYHIGDIGPSGGIVFYVDPQNTEHGLECAVDDGLFNGKKFISWHDANTLGKDGWRLPFKNELNLLYLNKNIIPNLKNNTIDYKGYWTADEYNSQTAYYQYFGNGALSQLVKTYGASVRLVKAF